jgi:hypothetical protein
MVAIRRRAPTRIFESDEGIVCATRNCGEPCVASWGWSRSQGLGCSPIKAARELGLERRETVDVRAVCKSGHMLGSPEHPALPFFGTRTSLCEAEVTRKQTVTMRPVRTISRKDRTGNRRNPQRPYAGHGAIREEMVRPPWRHGEPGGTQTTWPPRGAANAGPRR